MYSDAVLHGAGAIADPGRSVDLVASGQRSPVLPRRTHLALLLFLLALLAAACGGSASVAQGPATDGGAGDPLPPITLGFWTHGFKDASLIGVDWHLDRLAEGREVMPTFTFPIRNSWLPGEEPARSDALAQLARLPVGLPVALRPPDNLMEGCPALPGAAKYVLDPLSDVRLWRDAADARAAPAGFGQLRAHLATLRPARIMILDNNEVPEVMQASAFLADARAQALYPAMRTEADANRILAGLYAERYGAFREQLQTHFDQPIVVVPYKGLHHGEWLGFRWRYEGHGRVPEGELSSWDGTHATVQPYWFQGASPSIYDNPWEPTSDNTLRAPLVRACALLWAGVADARAIDPGHVRCVSLWDGGAAMRARYGRDLPTAAMTPARYKGWTKAVLLLLGPDVVHLYRNHLDLRAEHEAYDMAVADAVREINQDPVQLAAARGARREILVGPWRHPFSGIWQRPEHKAWPYLRCLRRGPTPQDLPTPLYPPHLDRPPEGQSPPGVPEGQWRNGSFNPNVALADANTFAAVAVGIAIDAGIVLHVWCPDEAQPRLRIEVPGHGGIDVAAPAGGSTWLLHPDGSLERRS